ncbi:MAG: class I SAM-dependent methyltransferase [Xanthobacteraceae bacterium]|nr:MAG: class I SAM-dependent methyltransferase [Xanthobacteraceae bacterium]
MPASTGHWIDYYDSAHTLYVSERHRRLHFKVIADGIIAAIPSPDAAVLDYSCGEALDAGRVAHACGRLILAEPAPTVRARLTARFAGHPNIEVRSLDELAGLPPHSLDLVTVISVAQYLTPDELDATFALVRRLLRPGGLLVLGDVLDPRVGMFADAWSLIRFGARAGFLIDAVLGLMRTALSDYRYLRWRLGLTRYSEAAMLAKLAAAGFSARRAPENLGHNPWRMTFVATPEA